MKTCPQCGINAADTAKFCRSCGALLAPAADVQPETMQERQTPQEQSTPGAQSEPAISPVVEEAPAAEAPAAEASSETTASTAETPGATIESSTAFANDSVVKTLDCMKAHKKPFAIGAAVLVVLTIIIIAVNMFSRPISTDQLKSDLMQDSFVTNGAVSDNYVNESTYEITDLSISDEQTGSQTILGTSYDMVTVTYSGTMKNDNFETQFAGVGYYYKVGNSYQCMNCDSNATETKPLKGVDAMSTSTGNNVTVSDFTSDLSGSNGTYTSTASQKVTYDFWFATDTCTNTQTFTFNASSGWRATGDVGIADQKTEWKLAGKSFALNDESNIFASDWTRSSDITFTACSTESVEADYAFNASYDLPSQYMVDNYKDVALSGSLMGTATHDFGSETFKIELNDSENSVTFQLQQNYLTVRAGTGTVNSLLGTIDTETVYYQSTWLTEKYSDSQLVYAEQTTA